MRSLPEFRQMLERLKGGTIPAELGLEIIAAAEEEIEQAVGEFTLAQAMERSGKSRSYFQRRLSTWAAQGLARRPGREWLLKAAVIPRREVHGGFDPSLSADEVTDAIWSQVRVA
ncbi:MAG TPA: hypothetical protein VFI96_04210 [Longimicrobiaceae bacterium]|nr:hypothetical protein [Longimicrobiaceae bacterium]